MMDTTLDYDGVFVEWEEALCEISTLKAHNAELQEEEKINAEQLTTALDERDAARDVVRHLLSQPGTPNDEWIKTHAPWLKEGE